MDFASAQMTETQPPLRLPNPNEAIIPAEKLKGYALNPDHGLGKEKAHVFKSALGIGQEDWEYLRDQILSRVADGEVHRVEPKGSGFQYEIIIWIDGLNGATQPVATRWIVQPDQPPRLSSTWVDI
jgi:hypothetical protein